jgi:hypothetical protein
MDGTADANASRGLLCNSSAPYGIYSLAAPLVLDMVLMPVEQDLFHYRLQRPGAANARAHEQTKFLFSTIDCPIAQPYPPNHSAITLLTPRYARNVPTLDWTK